MERKILNAIPEDGSKINTLEIVSKVYPIGGAPRNARQSVLDSANKLIQKSDDNDEDWELFKSKARGSQPIFFWREKRRRSD